MFCLLKFMFFLFLLLLVLIYGDRKRFVVGEFNVCGQTLHDNNGIMNIVDADDVGGIFLFV